jgi:hypothetical protein
MSRHFSMRPVSSAAALGCLILFGQSALAAERRVEAAAQAALKKAAADYRSKHYAAAAERLEKASRACGTDRCTPATTAAVLRDLGTMQFRQGDTSAASKSFADAIAVAPDLNLNRRYTTPDLQAAWDAAKANAASNASGTGSFGEATTGSPTTPPPEAAPAPEPPPSPTPPAPVDEDAERPNAAPGAYEHLWIGVAGAVDFLVMPTGNDFCRLTQGGFPANSSNAYCTNPDGTDFPTRASPDQNNALVPGRGGDIVGGLQIGDIRIMAAVDYAFSPSFLLGVRGGYVLNTYPAGGVAVHDGRAFGRSVHAELRGTYLFGHAPLAAVGFAPMVFVGGGISEFDGHVTADVTLNGIAGRERVNVWVTDGPGFATVGGGFRYQFSLRAAFMAALRVNAAFFDNGLLPTAGPEVSFQYGF